MEEVVERLKKEKDESETYFFNEGKNDGLEFAKSASYEDIQYALKWNPMYNEGGLVSYDPTRDEILGDYFKEIIEGSEFMDFVETTYGNYIPNDIFAAWEDGWVKGVKEFWEEIKNKL